MPIIQIQLLEGRSENQIREIISSVTNAVVKTAHVPAENVRVIVTEIAPTHWAVAGKTKAETTNNH